MSTEIKVPVLPESIADAVLAQWHKNPGDTVKQDESLVDIETDKVILEVTAPCDGVFESALFQVGAIVKGQQVIGTISAHAASVSTPPLIDASHKVSASLVESSAPSLQPVELTLQTESEVVPTREQPVFATSPSLHAEEHPDLGLSPAVRKELRQHQLSAQEIMTFAGTTRLSLEDIERFVTAQEPTAPQPVVLVAQEIVQPIPSNRADSIASSVSISNDLERAERRVPMSRMRLKIAERLVHAQHTAAMLTTFNEIDMEPVMSLRAHYKDEFEKKHSIKLGFMSFFIKACSMSLERFPVLNASIDNDHIVYHDYCDIGIAVASERGLVVPILRDVQTMTLADCEHGVALLSKKAREASLTMNELTGGTFTITNGGVFGSLLSTPILNPPQTAILGMHKIEPRPVVIDNQIVIRPMMYVALSYDHRLIDGADAVQFLVAVKTLLQEPERFLLDL